MIDEVVMATGERNTQDSGGPFKHEIGEIVMTAKVAGDESDQEHDLVRRRELVWTLAGLNELVKWNEVLFPTEGVKGKLEAFFEWQEERSSGSGAII